jgi:hypothetical protein
MRLKGYEALGAGISGLAGGIAYGIENRPKYQAAKNLAKDSDPNSAMNQAKLAEAKNLAAESDPNSAMNQAKLAELNSKIAEMTAQKNLLDKQAQGTNYSNTGPSSGVAGSYKAYQFNLQPPFQGAPNG